MEFEQIRGLSLVCILCVIFFASIICSIFLHRFRLDLVFFLWNFLKTNRFVCQLHRQRPLTRIVTWSILTNINLRNTSLYMSLLLFHHGHQTTFDDTYLLQVSDQPFNRLLESAFLGGLHCRLALGMEYRMSIVTE